MNKLLLSLFLSLAFVLNLHAQDDLMDLLESQEEETTELTIATFKTVRIINAHTIEAPAHGVLSLLISHRFGKISGGAYEFFGLDQANMRIGLEYGVNDRLSVGIGRSNVFKTIDGFAKAKILRQSTGKEVMPLSLSLLTTVGLNTVRLNDDRGFPFETGLEYTAQLLLARKFSEKLSIQLMPSMVHRNIVPTAADPNDVFAVGLGGRYKLTHSTSINGEWYYRLPGSEQDGRTNALSVGFDIETGGHVFQLVFSNSRLMSDNLFIAETTGDVGAGDIHFGFTISRVFTVHRPGEVKKKK